MGHVIFLPYFNLQEYDKKSRGWSAKAIQISHGLRGQLIAIDKFLRQQTTGTPAPQWVEETQAPKDVTAIDLAIAVIDAEIAALTLRKEEEIVKRERLLTFSKLLYENGKALEAVIQEGLHVLGFGAENYHSGDLEIDHVIVGPEGVRMIGESEGKDSSAIDISKFRQLESNINEDFQRDEVVAPAKGILFGNGFRFTKPEDRAEQFTIKCMTNAKRLRTALVTTTDLYKAVVYVLDHPEDEAFRAACRNAIETTEGEVVVFPIGTTHC